MGGAGGGCGAEGGRQVPLVRRDSGVETEQMAGTWWRENVGLWLWKVQPCFRCPCSLFRRKAQTQASSACVVLSAFDMFTSHVACARLRLCCIRVTFVQGLARFML